MGAFELTVLAVAAFLTSILSAVVGMGGGITLLAVTLLFLEPLAAIPLLGVVQLMANGSRSWIQRRHVERGVVLRYALPLLPMGFVGLLVAEALPPAGTRALIGAFVLLATWAPGALLLGTHPERADPNRRFLLLGAVVGVVNIAIGATGPLIAPFFLNLGLTRHALVGTKAACQALGHLAKIAVFGIAGFAFGNHLPLLALLCLAVVVGTWVGSRLLERVSEAAFVTLYRVVLTVIALRLVVWEGLTLTGWL